LTAISNTSNGNGISHVIISTVMTTAATDIRTIAPAASSIAAASRSRMPTGVAVAAYRRNTVAAIT